MSAALSEHTGNELMYVEGSIYSYSSSGDVSESEYYDIKNQKKGDVSITSSDYQLKHSLYEKFDYTGEIGEVGEGLIYASVSDYYSDGGTGFYDSTKALKINLGDMGINNLPKYRDGVCWVEILNPDGISFVGLMDKKGNMKFEPVAGYIDHDMNSPDYVVCQKYTEDDTPINLFLLTGSGDTIELGNMEFGYIKDKYAYGFDRDQQCFIQVAL